MSGRYRRLVDLVELTGLLQSTTSGLSIDQIAERFEVSRRTAERMLEALRERFPALQPQLREGRKYWLLPSGEHGRPLLMPGELDQLALRVVELEARVEQHAIADQVLASSIVGIFVLDADFRVVWINPALERLFEISREDVVGHDKRKLLDEEICCKFENPETYKRRIHATYDDNSYVEHFQCRLLSAGGAPGRWLEHWSQPIEAGPYTGGRIEHYVEVSPQGSRSAVVEPGEPVDVSKLSSINVGESSSELLRGPLAHLIETARQGLEGKLDADTALEEIRSAAGCIEDSLSTSLYSVARGDLCVERVEAGAVLQSVADQLRSRVRGAGVELRVTCDEEPIRFAADSTLLVHAIVDLALAEIEELERGDILELIAARSSTPECVNLILRTQAGANSARAPSVEPDVGGGRFGSLRPLALSVASEIVARHGGDISVIREDVGRAPAFSLQLPIGSLE